MPQDKPYTNEEVRKEKCFRCGKPAFFQWTICALGNLWYPVCKMCDFDLNRVVLRWARVPGAAAILRKYKAGWRP